MWHDGHMTTRTYSKSDLHTAEIYPDRMNGYLVNFFGSDGTFCYQEWVPSTISYDRMSEHYGVTVTAVH